MYWQSFSQFYSLFKKITDYTIDLCFKLLTHRQLRWDWIYMVDVHRILVVSVVFVIALNYLNAGWEKKKMFLYKKQEKIILGIMIK
jgi:hypothetical protein